MYFSENASFADNYAFKYRANAYMNKKAILCCRVSTGFSKNYNNVEDESLTEPPMIDPKNPELGRYDSVCGELQNEKVYVLYEG